MSDLLPKLDDSPIFTDLSPEFIIHPPIETIKFPSTSSIPSGKMSIARPKQTNPSSITQDKSYEDYINYGIQRSTSDLMVIHKKLPSVDYGSKSSAERYELALGAKTHEFDIDNDKSTTREILSDSEIRKQMEDLPDERSPDFPLFRQAKPIKNLSSLFAATENTTTRSELTDFPAQSGLQFCLKVVQLEAENILEPVFGSLYFYDARNNCRITETFHFDKNTATLRNQIKDFLPAEDVSTKVDAGMFNILENPSNILLIIRVEKILPKEFESSDLSRDSNPAKQVSNLCGKAGMFRVPFAWHVISLFSLLNMEGNSTSSKSTATDSSLKSFSGQTNNFEFFELGGVIPFEAQPMFRSDERIQDADILSFYKGLKKNSSLPRKLKLVNGKFSFKILPVNTDNINIFTANLDYIPSQSGETSSVKEVLNLPSPLISNPMYYQKNILFLHPKSLNLTKIPSLKSVAVKVEFISDGNNQMIFGRSNCPEFCQEMYLSLGYKSKNVFFNDEVKMRLPAQLNKTSHILFTFYSVANLSKLDVKKPAVIGYTWLSLGNSGFMECGDFNLPISVDKPEGYYEISTKSEDPSLHWFDNQRPLFSFSLTAMTTIHPNCLKIKNALKKLYGVSAGGSDHNFVPITRALQNISPDIYFPYLYQMFDRLFLILIFEEKIFSKESQEKKMEIHKTLISTITSMAKQVGSAFNHEDRNITLSIYSDVIFLSDPQFDKFEDLHKIKIFLRLIEIWITADGSERSNMIEISSFFLALITKSIFNYCLKNKIEYLTTSEISKIEELVMLVLKDMLSLNEIDKTICAGINKELAFFVRHLFFVIPLKYVYTIISSYCSLISTTAINSGEKINIFLFKFDFYDIICSFEYFYELILTKENKIILTFSDVVRKSRNSPISDVFSLDSFGITTGYLGKYFLIGFVMVDLINFMKMGNLSLQNRASSLLKNMLVYLDCDPRFENLKAQIVDIFIPLIFVISGIYGSSEGISNQLLFTLFRPQSDAKSTPKDKTEDKTQLVSKKSSNASKTNLLFCFKFIMDQLSEHSLHSLYKFCSLVDIKRILSIFGKTIHSFEYKGKKYHELYSVNAMQKMNRAKFQLEQSLVGTGGARHQYIKMVQQRGSGTRAPMRYRPKSGNTANYSSEERSDVDIQVEATLSAHFCVEATSMVMNSCEKIISYISQDRKKPPEDILNYTMYLYSLVLQTENCSEIKIHCFKLIRGLVYRFPAQFWSLKCWACEAIVFVTFNLLTSTIPLLQCHAGFMTHYFLTKYSENINKSRYILVSILRSVDIRTKDYNDCDIKRTLCGIQYINTAIRLRRDHTLNKNKVTEPIDICKSIIYNFEAMRDSTEPNTAIDHMIEIAELYRPDSELRLEWLQKIAKKHNECGNIVESAYSLLQATSLSYAYIKNNQNFEISGVFLVDLNSITPNTKEESKISPFAIMDNLRTFTTFGFYEILEMTVAFFKLAKLYEAAEKLLKLSIPFHYMERNYAKLAQVHGGLREMYETMYKSSPTKHSFYHCKFRGKIFGEINGSDFIYYGRVTPAGEEIISYLKKTVDLKYGGGKITVKTDSGDDLRKLSADHNMILVQSVEIYNHKKISSHMNSAMATNTFFTSKPFFKGKQEDGILAQYVSRHIYTTREYLPHIRVYSKILRDEEVTLSPIEVAIEDLSRKVSDLDDVLLSKTPNPILLQLFIQSIVGTVINLGPREMVATFLRPIVDKKESPTCHHYELVDLVNRMITSTYRAINVNMLLITPDQKEYQIELSRSFTVLRESMMSLIDHAFKCVTKKPTALMSVEELKHEAAKQLAYYGPSFK